MSTSCETDVAHQLSALRMGVSGENMEKKTTVSGGTSMPRTDYKLSGFYIPTFIVDLTVNLFTVSFRKNHFIGTCSKNTEKWIRLHFATVLCTQCLKVADYSHKI